MPRILPGRRPDNLGVQDGQLRPAGNKPNCVSSQDQRPRHHVEPLALAGNPAEAIDRLATALKTQCNAEIVSQTDDYLHAECSSKGFGFVDDVEAYADSDAGQIQLRSASRVGYSDWGVNRKRIEQLRAAVQAGGPL